MVVYEAINRSHYFKVAQFLASQPKDSFWVQCFKGVITQNTANFIDFLKQQKPRFHIFVCEDTKGKVRAIEVFETRGERPNEPKILTNYLPFWDENDRKKKDYSYVKEMIMYAFSEEWLLKYGTYEYVEGIIAEPDFGLLDSLPKNIVVTAEFDTPLGKVRRYRFYPKGVPGATK